MYCGGDGNVPENNCARQFGGTVDVWDCEKVETYDDNVPQRYLIASWHMDESGVLVSDLVVCALHGMRVITSVHFKRIA